MSRRYVVTMDRAGRIVVPKALRDHLGVVPGQSLPAQVRDGRLEIEPEPIKAHLVEVDGLVAEWARVAGLRLISLDVRALSTYSAVGVDVEWIG